MSGHQLTTNTLSSTASFSGNNNDHNHSVVSHIRQLSVVHMPSKTKYYGIIPWVYHEDSWFCLLQLSLLSYKLKVDPIRGEYVQDGVETPIRTAIREMFEMSSQTLDFRQVEHLIDDSTREDSLFHIRVVFDNVEEVMPIYDDNRKMLGDEQDGLVFAQYDELAMFSLKLSSHGKEVMKVNPNSYSMPMFTMKKTICDDGMTRFIATVGKWRCSSLVLSLLDPVEERNILMKKIAHKLFRNPEEEVTLKKELEYDKSLNWEDIKKLVEELKGSHKQKIHFSLKRTSQ